MAPKPVYREGVCRFMMALATRLFGLIKQQIPGGLDQKVKLENLKIIMMKHLHVQFWEIRKSVLFRPVLRTKMVVYGHISI